MNLPSLRELRDARDGVGRRVRVLSAVAFGDEDVAVRRDDDVVRLGERLGRIAADAGLAERHQHLAVRAELDDLVADRLGRRRRRAAGASRGAAPRAGRGWLSLAVGHPDVAVAVDVDAVREDHHPAPKLFDELAGRDRTSGPDRAATSCPWPRSQQLLAPQRSPTQIDVPSLSMSTALVDPQVRPLGSLTAAVDSRVRVREVVDRLYAGRGRLREQPGPRRRTSCTATSRRARDATSRDLRSAFGLRIRPSTS